MIARLVALDGGRDILIEQDTVNGQRVEVGWLRPGDELCIAHLRFRVEQGPDWRPLENGPDPPVPIQPRSWIPDLFSQHSRFRFISRN